MIYSDRNRDRHRNCNSNDRQSTDSLNRDCVTTVSSLINNHEFGRVTIMQTRTTWDDITDIGQRMSENPMETW